MKIRLGNFLLVSGIAFSVTGWAATRNGDLDVNFGVDGVQIVDFGAQSTAFGLAIAPDGKIVLGGSVDGGMATSGDFGVARLLADGSVDTSFSFDGRTTAVVGMGASYDQTFNTLVQVDGKIVVIGDAYPTEGMDATTDMALVRFNTDGTLDTTFSGDGKAFVDFGLSATPNDRALDAVQLPDGKLIVVGTADVTDEEGDFAIVKLNVDGTRDTSFDSDGRVTFHFDLDLNHRNETASSVAIDGSGRILVAGIAEKAQSSYDFAVARLLPNGQLDPNFSGDGRASIAFDIGGNQDDAALELILAPDGSIFLTGAATDAGYDAAVVKLLPDGSLDVSFGGDGRVTVPFDLGDGNQDIFYGAALQPDGALVLAGYVQVAAPNNSDLAFVRLLPNGDLDPNFGLAGKSIIPLDIGGDLQDAATRIRYSNGAMIFGGAANIGGYLSFMSGRVLIDVVFSDDFENP